MSGKKKRRDTQKPRPDGRGFHNRKTIDSRKKPPRAGWFGLFWSRYGKIVVPCVVFFALVGIFIFIYSRLLTSGPFHAFMAYTAQVTGFLLDLTGRDTTVRDTVVSSRQFAFQIVDLCTAIMPMMILTAAIVAFPSRIKEKAFGLLIGLAGIFVVNEIRLISLFYIGIYLPDIFETAHLLVWQSLMILVAIGLWLIWVYKYVRTSAL
jgi:exosortase/archaeosortase family protein